MALEGGGLVSPHSPTAPRGSTHYRQSVLCELVPEGTGLGLVWEAARAPGGALLSIITSQDQYHLFTYTLVTSSFLLGLPQPAHLGFSVPS